MDGEAYQITNLKRVVIKKSDRFNNGKLNFLRFVKKKKIPKRKKNEVAVDELGSEIMFYEFRKGQTISAGCVGDRDAAYCSSKFE